MYDKDFARANNDYRRELLSRSWTRNAAHRRRLPHLPSVRRARRAA